MARKKVNTLEDKVRYEIINEGYSLFPSLKIRINEQRDKGFNYLDSVNNLINDHKEVKDKVKIITQISDKCYDYLLTVIYM